MQNLVILPGNVGATPEARTTQGGTHITHFSLATSRPKRDSNGKILRDDNNRLEDTEWHRILCFNGVGKTVEHYVDKGMKLMVRGRIHYTRWTDSENIERYDVEIIADEVTFPNVLITGHQAFFTAEALAEIARTTIENLSSFEDKGVPANPVAIST